MFCVVIFHSLKPLFTTKVLLSLYVGSEIMGYQIQIGWGKAVALPPAPIYVSPDQLEQENLKDPDPSSGLPFNAQVKTGMRKIDKDGDNLEQVGSYQYYLVVGSY